MTIYFPIHHYGLDSPTSCRVGPSVSLEPRPHPLLSPFLAVCVAFQRPHPEAPHAPR